MILIVLHDTLSCLRELYRSTDGDHWYAKQNWATSDDYCTFYGVKCDNVTKQLVQIELCANNMVGELPACFAELEVKTIIFQVNRLSGAFPNVSDSTTTLDVYGNEFTALPKNWCAAKRSTIRFSSNPVKRAMLPICYLEQPSTNYTGLPLIFEKGDVTLDKTTCFTVSGCDLSQVVLTFGDISNLREIELSYTGVQSTNALNLTQVSAYSTIIQLGGAHIKLTGELGPSVYTIDISGCQYDRVFDFSMIPQNLSYFSAQNASLLGFGPTMQQIDDYIMLPNKFIDLNDNPFFCRGNDAFGCVYLVIDTYYTAGGRFHFGIYIEQHMQFDLLTPDLSIVMKNFSNTDKNVQVPIRLENCVFGGKDRAFTAECDIPNISLPKQYDVMQDFAILYKDIQVSAGALNMYVEINDLLADPYHDNFTESSEAFVIPAQKEPFEFEFTCTAMSHCHDYADFVIKTLYPLYNTYPELAAKLQYHYVSFSTVEPFFDQNATSMHSQIESKDDKVLSCANAYLDDPTYVSFSACYSQKYSTYECLYNTLGTGMANDILLCAEDEALGMLTQQMAEQDVIYSNECPTAYLRRAGEETYTKICQGFECKGGADKIKRYICAFLGDDGADVC